MKHTSPAATIGVVGGGQLGRMLGEAAGPLGVDILVLDPTPECPASAVVRDQIVGEFDDENAIRHLAERADILTYEIELADPDALETVSRELDIPVQPDPTTLRMIQDKARQNDALAAADIPIPDYTPVDSVHEIRAAGSDFGWPLMLKARRGGYDGRGNVPVNSPNAATGAFEEIGGGALVEEFVSFRRELSVIGVKGAQDTRVYPVTETIHQQEILRETVTPARCDDATTQLAQSIAQDVLDMLDGWGVYGIELFEVESPDGSPTIYVNEIAPRPHNSGHWTIEGAFASQFEQHIRAILGWPLAPIGLKSPTISANILGDVTSTQPAELFGVESILSEPSAHLHWYGKHEVRPLRKMGHITLNACDASDTLDDLHDTAQSLIQAVSFVE